VYAVDYNDLIELARMCLLRASAASTPAVADELRRMAKERPVLMPDGRANA
jgi:hypothetical protein